MQTILKNILALAAVAMTAQAGAQVTFYEREAFQGESFTTRRQIEDFSRFGFNDSATSVVVAGEAWERWEVCDNTRFTGRCVVLRPGQYPNLRAMGLTNRIASVQALARETTPAPVVSQPPMTTPSRVVFFEKEGFGGRSFTATDDLGDFTRTGFNDRVSSIEVVGGPWQVCQDSGYGGPCVVLRAGKYPSLKAMGLDNRLSSARALPRESVPAPVVSQPPITAPSRVVFFESEGFGGRSFATSDDLGDFSRTGFNDRISSVEVVGGTWEVCQNSAYSGPCVVLRPGKYPSLKTMGLDNRLSSVRALGRDIGPANSAPRLVFYESEGYGGRAFVAQGDVGDIGISGFSDRASSVEVMGAWFEVCQGTGFTGQCAFLRPGKYPSLISMGLANRISSARIVRNPAFK